MMRRLLALCVVLAVPLLACQEPLSDDPMVRGRQLYGRLDCGRCHFIDGAGGRVGPELTHIGTVARTRAAGLTADEYVRRSIQDPGSYVVPGYNDVMPRGLARRLSDTDLDALVRWLLSHE